MSSKNDQLEELISINTLDFLSAFGLERTKFGRSFLHLLCWLPARQFARRIIQFDDQVGAVGLQKAARYTLSGFVKEPGIFGKENIPPSGPLLILSNHPGMSDTLVQFAAIHRPDLRIIAGERPFLQALPNLDPYLIDVPDDASRRMSVVRSALNHLRRGGAVLIFPAGEIEPDPDLSKVAAESLQNWSDSLALFARFVPELQILPSVVRGVVWRAAANSPFTRLRKTRKDQERVAAAIQILIQSLFPGFRPVQPSVSFGTLILGSDLAGMANPAEVKQRIIDQVHPLLESTNPDSIEQTGFFPDPLLTAIRPASN